MSLGLSDLLHRCLASRIGQLENWACLAVWPLELHQVPFNFSRCDVCCLRKLQHVQYEVRHDSAKLWPPCHSPPIWITRTSRALSMNLWQQPWPDRAPNTKPSNLNDLPVWCLPYLLRRTHRNVLFSTRGTGRSLKNITMYNKQNSQHTYKTTPLSPYPFTKDGGEHIS